MKPNILMLANRYIRNERPAQDDIVCETFFHERSLEVAFLSKRCCNDKAGSCIMCDYGFTNKTHRIESYIFQLEEILKEYIEKIDSVLLCTNGSVFNEEQISNELFTEILRCIKRYDIDTIGFEIHYLDITTEKLNLIKNIVGNKNIFIEIGLESLNDKIQKTLIMKNIEYEKIDRVIVLLDSFHFKIVFNIMLGIPFLSPKGQLDDSLKTIQWAFDRKADVVIFPINIKPYTLLEEMYLSNFYQPISIWLLVLLLTKIEQSSLDKVTIAYYGNREEANYDSSKKTVFPLTCSKCQKPSLSFFQQFQNMNRSIDRSHLLNEFINNRECSCFDNLQKTIQMSEDAFDQKYNSFVQHLIRKYEEINK